MDRQSWLIERRRQERRVHREETDPRKESTRKISLIESRSMESPEALFDCWASLQTLYCSEHRHPMTIEWQTTMSCLGACQLHRQWFFSTHDASIIRRVDLEGIMFQGIRSSRETSLLHRWANRFKFNSALRVIYPLLRLSLLCTVCHHHSNEPHLVLRRFDQRFRSA